MYFANHENATARKAAGMINPSLSYHNPSLKPNYEQITKKKNKIYHN